MLQPQYYICFPLLGTICDLSGEGCCAPLYNGALRLSEALLLVPPGCVRHIPRSLGLDCDVIFQCHVADLQAATMC